MSVPLQLTNQYFTVWFSVEYTVFLCFILQTNYKADYEDMKTRCFYPQTMTPEYEVTKKLQQCKDVSLFLNLRQQSVSQYAWVTLSKSLKPPVSQQSSCSHGNGMLYLSDVLELLEGLCCLFYRKYTGNIRTKWNSRKWRIRQFNSKLPSMPYS